jgi:hypothetical protein
VRNDPSIDNDQEVALQNRKEEPIQSSFWTSIRRATENYSREIFWLALYTLVLLAIFAERAYCKLISVLKGNYKSLKVSDCYWFLDNVHCLKPVNNKHNILAVQCNLIFR